MRMFNRRNVFNLCCTAVFLGLATVLVMAGASLALAETPPASSEPPSPVLLAFHADWCGACRQMDAAVDALARDGYNVERVNIDQNRELAAKFGVDSIPCFVVVERGKEVDRIVGQTSIERLKVKLRINANRRVDVSKKNPPERRPHPAWRYEKPVGHRAAVVRVYCQDDVRTRSIGSGTLVKWGAKKIVVLTARHVIADAKRIVVELFNKKTCKARVLKVDAVWDCAVLELDGRPDGVLAVDVELGDAAMQREGNRLESCGYGPDGKLAVNSGLFLGYRRSTQTPNGPDDWFEISGHARQGDSGGGIFNERGRLVGVLWGTNGEVVVGVQAGRIHVLLDAATAPVVDPKSYTPLQFISRRPTPPKPAVPIESLPPVCDGSSGCCPMPGPEPCEEPADATAVKKPAEPLLPWRGGAQRRDADLDARTRDLLQAIEAERQARLAGQQSPQIAEPPKTEAKEEGPSPLLAGLCVLGAVVVGFVVYFAAASKS